DCARKMHGLDGAIAVGSATQCDNPRIAIGLLPGARGISDAALLGELLEQPGGHAASERLDEQRKRRESRVRCGEPWKPQAPMRLLALAAVVAQGAGELGSASWDPRAAPH